MMKRILSLLLLIPAIALAQPLTGNKVEVTSGTLTCESPTGASKILKAESSASANGDAGVQILGVVNTQANTLAITNGHYSPLAVDGTGSLNVTMPYPNTSGGGSPFAKEDDASIGAHAGAIALFKRQDTPANTSGTDGDYEEPQMSGGRLWVSAAMEAGALNGCTPYAFVSAANTNATVIKASPGQICGWYIYNSNAAARKIMFHNSTTTPTAGAGTYFPMVIPAASAANQLSGVGAAFTTGIAFTMVTGLANSDATGVAANDLVGVIFYK